MPMATEATGASVDVVIRGSVDVEDAVVVDVSPPGVQPATTTHTAATEVATKLGGRGITAM
jgi:hypothetical protein